MLISIEDRAAVRRALPPLILRWLSLPFVLVMASLWLIDHQLKAGPLAQGIVEFELCALSASCAEILAGWSGRQRELAMLSLGLDFLFLVLYPAVIAAALVVIARRLSGLARSLSSAFAWLVLAAGLMDAVENYCLIRLLGGADLEVFALPAALLAAVKFLIVFGLALPWLAGCGAWLLWLRRKA